MKTRDYNNDYHIKKNDEIVDRYVHELMKISSGIVIKQQVLANKYETPATNNAYGEYYLAYNKLDTIDNHEFTNRELEDVGMSPDEIEDFRINKHSISPTQEELLMTNKRHKIINEYEEKNNYYRMLMGLPDNEDDHVIILYNEIEGAPNMFLDVDLTVPITQYNNLEIATLEEAGFINLIKKKYPKKRYLNYLGNKKIHFYNARIANSMALLYTPNNINETILVKFKDYYQENIAYSKRVLTNQSLSRYEYYEGLLIVFTLLAAIRQTLVGYLQLIINKDYFDDDIIKNIFLSYGVDTFDELPKYIRIQLAKNINSLLQNKGTDDVIVDICKIFGFTDKDVFKFYLFKDHRVDNNNEFIYKTKEIPNPEKPSEKIEVLDYEQMYDLYFVKTPITESDPMLYANDSLNRYEYDAVTYTDKFWATGEDKEEFKKKILSTDFNYIETKYITINNIYSLVDLLFELNYFFRAVKDNKDTISDIKISMTKVSSGKITLFEAITSLFALTAAKLGFDGNIFTTPTTALSFLGFNFEADIDKLKEMLKDTKYADILDDFQHMTPNMSAADFLNKFFLNKGVYTKIRKALATCSDYKTFIILKKVEKALLYVKDVASIYDNKATFLEYLKDTNFELYKILNDTIKEDQRFNYEAGKRPIELLIREILASLEEILHDSRFTFLFMSIPNITSEFLKLYLYKVIDFFKSYTIELDKMSLYYVILGDQKPEIRLLTEIHSEKMIKDITTINGTYSDTICTDKTIIISDRINSKTDTTRYHYNKTPIRRID